MEKIIKIENYSLTKIDIANYTESFLDQRQKYFGSLTSINIDSIDPFQICNFLIEKNNIKQVDFLGGDGYICTYSLLKWLVFEIGKKANLNELTTNIRSLHKRVEVDRCIYSYYDKDFKKSDSALCCLENYAWVSVILSLLYLITDNFNYFNTALKINDVLVQENDEKNIDIFYLAAYIEMSILNRLKA